jgi:hypothetical protein
MAKTWESNGKSGLTLYRDDLSPAGQKAYDTCRKSYLQNKADRAAFDAILTAEAGKPTTGRFTFGGGVNVGTPKAKAASKTSAPGVKVPTLAEYMAAL